MATNTAADPAAGLLVLNDLPYACDIGQALDHMRAHRLSQLWVCPPLHIARDAEALERARASGWQIHISPPRDGELAAPSEQPAAADDWIIAFRPGEWTPAGYSLVFPALDPRRIWSAAEGDAQSLQAALATFARAVGVPYYRTPQATGARLLRALHSGPHATALETATTGKAELPRPSQREHGAEIQDAPIMWRRPVTSDALEAHGPYLLTFDMNAQFLRATNGLPLGFGAVTHLTAYAAEGYTATAWRAGMPKAPRLIAPGYYRVWATNASGAFARLGIPHPLYRANLEARAFAPSGVWVNAPTVRLLLELRIAFACSEAYTWQTSHRFFDPWYKRLNAARLDLMADASPAGRLALDVVKQVYARTVGDLAYAKRPDDDPLKRPDWRHAVIAEARALHYRAMLRCLDRGYTPVLMTEDTLGWLSSTPDVTELATRLDLRVSATAGHYKIKDHIDLAAYPDVATLLCAPATTTGDLQKRLAAIRREQRETAGGQA